MTKLTSTLECASQQTYKLGRAHCEHCGIEIIEAPIRGRIKGCKHYPVDVDIYMPKPNFTPGETYKREDENDMDTDTMTPTPFGYGEDND